MTSRKEIESKAELQNEKTLTCAPVGFVSLNKTLFTCTNI